MRRSHPPARRTLALAIAAVAAAAPPAHADSASCDEPFAALLKERSTPNHAYMSHTDAVMKGQVKQIEMVNVSGMRYLMVNGKWTSHPAHSQAEVAELKANFAGVIAKGEATCARVGAEVVGGEPAVVYSTHQKLGDGLGVADTKLWVSAARGLPLRLVVDRSEGKTHEEIRYDYANVQAPTAR